MSARPSLVMRRAQAATLVREGCSLAEIRAHFGVSLRRARFLMGERRVRRAPRPDADVNLLIAGVRW